MHNQKAVRILNEDLTKSFTHHRDVTSGPRPRRNIPQNNKKIEIRNNTENTPKLPEIEKKQG